MDYLQLKRKVENKTEGVIEYKISGAIRSKLWNKRLTWISDVCSKISVFIENSKQFSTYGHRSVDNVDVFILVHMQSPYVDQHL